MNQPLLTIVVPCYNEDEVFKETAYQLSSVLRKLMDENLISQQSMILFVDDGSRDSKSAEWFYRLMHNIGVKLIYNHADYRLMSKRALEQLVCFDESKIFLRGLVPLIGFRTAEVLYDRKERLVGLSKYPLRKMLSFAFNGLTSFSIAPIRVVALLGFLSFVFSCIAGGYAIIQNILGHTLTGWTSLMASIWFIGGLLLMSIGLIGEYIGKIYEEVKKRPRFIIETDLFSDKLE